MNRNLWLIALFACRILIAAPRASAVEQADVDKAIDRGVAALKRMQGVDGRWPHNQVGATALAGLTLLECGIEKTDPAIVQATDVLRREGIPLTHTYSIALTILFFDRLGDARDVPLIESLTVRLLAGRNAVGGWTYHCPSIAASEVRRLTRLNQMQAELRARPGGLVVEKPKRERTVRDLPREIRQQLVQVQRQRGAPAARKGRPSRDDNSNTQFAVMGLWAARRHGLPVDNAMAAVERRFRLSQNGDGGWGYRPVTFSTGARGMMKVRTGGARSRDTMTCAGLLGLAVSHGAANEARKKAGKNNRDVTKDVVLRNGLVALSTTIGEPARGGQAVIPRVDGRTYYFLWSLERVGVALGLRTIGKKDWYEWGAQLLLANQNVDGTWAAQFSTGGADTCFALLFLKRANLTRDLTPQFVGVLRDPGTVRLSSGGVGGEALKRLGKEKISSALDGNSKVEIEPDRGPIKEKTEVISADFADRIAGKLSEQLVEASGAEQSRLLAQLRDNKGSKNTFALATSIPLLSENVKTRARKALAERFTRMTASTLNRYARDDDAEIRRASVVASAMKDERSMIPEMIGLLDDPHPGVRAAARAALRAMTKKNFGPADDANEEQTQHAIRQWREWWKNNSGG